ncbi:MAG: NB-ARC domain-containing protein, partial [Cyanobacteria bacterium CRU_2_1]|nr:NB-ARC domain-containing protein [Cyanobacteria bacterium CRU_2_1]
PIPHPFKGGIWRSLRYTPSATETITELLQFVTNSRAIPTTSTLDQLISQLLVYLRTDRYLIALDDWESLLQEGELAGYCTKEHEGYSRLLKRLAEEQHQSCLLLISWDQPVELTSADKDAPVFVFKLRGLQSEEAERLLTTRGFSPDEPGLIELIQIHRGNPAALKIAATTIQELFDGDISQFLAQTSLVLGDVLISRLDHQFGRLSDLEKSVMYWLSIAGQPISLAVLKEEVRTVSRSDLIAALESLRRRSLIDKHSDFPGEVLFVLEPVVMKYVSQRLVTQVCLDFMNTIRTQSLEKLGMLRSHALIRLQDPDEVQQVQTRLILHRIRNHLIATLDGNLDRLRTHLETILTLLRTQHIQPFGYAEFNLVKLLEITKALSSFS